MGGHLGSVRVEVSSSYFLVRYKQDDDGIFMCVCVCGVGWCGVGWDGGGGVGAMRNTVAEEDGRSLAWLQWEELTWEDSLILCSNSPPTRLYFSMHSAKDSAAFLDLSSAW